MTKVLDIFLAFWLVVMAIVLIATVVFGIIAIIQEFRDPRNR